MEVADPTVEEIIMSISKVLAGIALAISALKLMQIGYMFLLQPATKKSDAKESIIPWLIGVFVCGSWLSLGQWVIDLFKDCKSDPFV